MPERAPPEECANCGSAIPRRARACPGCGADERSGWREQDAYEGLNLPDEAYASDDRPPKPAPTRFRINGLAWYWWSLGVALLILLVMGGVVLRW